MRSFDASLIFADRIDRLFKSCTFIVSYNVDIIILINPNDYAFSYFDNILQWMIIKQGLSFMNQILSNAE